MIPQFEFCDNFRKCTPILTILLFISVHISFVLFFPGSVEADVGRGGKLSSHLMASCFRNTCAKNRQNPLILFKVTIDNVGVPFLRHSVLIFTKQIIAS